MRPEIWVRGHSRSFQMAPFNRYHRTSYSQTMVTLALACTVYGVAAN